MTPLCRIAVRASTANAEPLRARLLELFPEGLEEADVDEATVEIAAYADVRRAKTVLAELPGATVVPVATGWEEAWREFHRPVVAGGLWLGPPWETAPDPACAVVIDPGRVFGTGSHPTTRLCVELLANTSRSGALLDVGCGSGVLAIAGARLGFAPVFAVDVDPVAVEAARANAEANGVALVVTVVDALGGTLPAADLAVANVLLRPVEAILARLATREVITSGYLTGERPVHTGWTHLETRELDGWAADRFRRST